MVTPELPSDLPDYAHLINDENGFICQLDIFPESYRATWETTLPPEQIIKALGRFRIWPIARAWIGEYRVPFGILQIGTMPLFKGITNRLDMLTVITKNFEYAFQRTPDPTLIGVGGKKLEAQKIEDFYNATAPRQMSESGMEQIKTLLRDFK